MISRKRNNKNKKKETHIYSNLVTGRALLLSLLNLKKIRLIVLLCTWVGRPCVKRADHHMCVLSEEARKLVK